MKSKLTLSIDSSLMKNINEKARLNKSLNISKMVEEFLFDKFSNEKKTEQQPISNLRGLLKHSEAGKNWKKLKVERLSKKYL